MLQSSSEVERVKIASGHYQVDGYTIKRVTSRAGVKAGMVTRWYVTAENGMRIGSADTYANALALLQQV